MSIGKVVKGKQKIELHISKTCISNLKVRIEKKTYKRADRAIIRLCL